MADLLTWSVPLGRASTRPVRLHVILLVYAAARVLEGSFKGGSGLVEGLAWLIVLGVALGLHELGHVLGARQLGLVRQGTILWPLGDMNRPTGSMLSRDQALVALAGPAASLAVALTVFVSLSMARVGMQLDPFGGASGGVPLGPGAEPLPAFSLLWWMGCLGHASWLIGLANLIPALPFDLGVAVRTWQRSSYRDTDLSPYLARASAVVLGLAGLFRVYFAKPGGLSLIAVAIALEWMVRWEARVAEEGGGVGEGLFGYDFSQGYTSLESSTPAVQSRRESALTRWHRRRAELRRRRLEARAAAAEARLDEILDKILREGRGSLTIEEERFLVAQSQSKRARRGRGPNA